MKLKTDDILAVRGDNASALLNPNSLRRRVIVMIVDHGGRMRYSELREKMGFDPRVAVHGLLRAGWLIKTDKEPQDVKRGKGVRQ